MTLNDKHVAELLASGIRVGVRVQRQYATVDSAGARAAGFPAYQARSGLLVPLYGPSGERVQVQLKPDRPRAKNDGRTLKYETPTGSRIRLDFPPRMRRHILDRKRDLWVTEGIKKTDAAASKGLVCVGLTGVDCWNVPEDWAHVPLRDRRVNIVYDNDVMRKPEVYSALQRITAFLEDQGARVYWVFLPDHDAKVGLDDYLVAGHTVADLRALARPSASGKAQAVRRAAARARNAGFEVGPRMSQADADQEAALHSIVEWFKGDERYLRFGGLAGTGKTTVVARIASRLGLSGGEVHYAAPTGKAARVLRGKLADANAVGAVTTLHKLLYVPTSFHCARCPSQLSEATACHGVDQDCGCTKVRFQRGEVQPLRLLVVDESSMVDQAIYDDLVATGYRIIFVGDPGQLPPVNSAFDLMNNPDVFLQHVARQQPGSAILDVAYAAREGKVVRYGKHGRDVIKARKGQPASEIQWDEHPMVLCNSNEHRVALNSKARKAAGRGREPEPGDKVVCLKNNTRAGIDNGLLGTLREVSRMDTKRYRVKIDLETSGQYSGFISAEQFGKEKALQGMRGVDLWDYAYALTVHKAQGSQADDVILFDAPWMENKDPEQYRRWLYTGITRAARHLTIVR